MRKVSQHHRHRGVADLHVWSIGPNIYAAEISIVTEKPNLPEHYKELIPNELGIVHACIEVHPCIDDPKTSDEQQRREVTKEPRGR